MYVFIHKHTHIYTHIYVSKHEDTCAHISAPFIALNKVIRNVADAIRRVAVVTKTFTFGEIMYDGRPDAVGDRTFVHDELNWIGSGAAVGLMFVCMCIH